MCFYTYTQRCTGIQKHLLNVFSKIFLLVYWLCPHTMCARFEYKFRLIHVETIWKQDEKKTAAAEFWYLEG